MGADELRLPLGVIQQRELLITGTFRYANTWPTAIALVASGRVSLDDLVTSEYGLADVEQALTATRDPQSVKAVVRPALRNSSATRGQTRSNPKRQARRGA
jgi:L-iditol 2-dehydrogenase